MKKIDKLLTRYQIDGQYLNFEVTEHGLMKRAKAAAQILEQLRSRNIQISVDDFGTGYSSLSYLHQYPINTLKIDRCFVHNLHVLPQNEAIVRAIIALASGLGVKTIAEGVETIAERDRLITLGSQFAQGYLFAQPIDAVAAEELLIQSQQQSTDRNPTTAQ